MSVTVDLSELALALGMNDVEVPWVFDLETGEVIFMNHDLCDEDDEDGVPEWQVEIFAKNKEIAANPERYIEIECRPSYEGYEQMEGFIETQPDAIATMLTRAIEQNKPFRRFREALSILPDEVTDAWYAFKNKREEEMAIAWLREREIEFVAKVRPVPQ